MVRTREPHALSGVQARLAAKFTLHNFCIWLRKDRTTAIILSILFGVAGIDRFYIGDNGMGILKLLTGGGCGILAIIDWFQIGGLVDNYNRAKAQEIRAAVQSMSGDGA